MAKLKMGLRVVFGLLWIVFGANFFFHFLPMPPPPEEGMKFMAGLMANPYFFPLVKVTEIAVGLMLLLNLAVPLALVIIAPVTLNIFLYNVVLSPSGTGLALAMVALNLILGILYFNSFKPLFKKS